MAGEGVSASGFGLNTSSGWMKIGRFWRDKRQRTRMDTNFRELRALARRNGRVGASQPSDMRKNGFRAGKTLNLVFLS